MTTRLTTKIAAFLLAVASLAMPHAPVLAQAAPAASAAPADAAPAPPPAAPAVTKETVDNPYGLSALWAQGDFVSRGTLIILVIMSMGS